MSDKYQVLEEPNRTSVIERLDSPANSSSKRVPKWRTIIPDAGSSNNAYQVARLLNKEHQELLDRQTDRTVDGEVNNG